MSMYRQLWLAIIVSMMLALAGSLLVSMVSARAYLQSQLSIKNSDNASALALSLSQGSPDPVSVELVVSALFDSGHYELIRVIDPMGQVIAERSAPLGELNAPAWFINILPIQATPGQAQISDGWQQFGTITLVSHSRLAYGALWNSALQMMIALSVACAIGGYLGSLILHRLKKPLRSVIDQARAITERRFITIAEPKVPELRQLAAAMNAMVARLKSMFDEEAMRLETVRREANCDALTGLANRNYFMARLRETALNDESRGGTLFIVRLAHLVTLNQELGRDATDALLRRFGDVLTESAAGSPDGLAARLNGADFALIVPDLSMPQESAEKLLENLVREAANFAPLMVTTWLACGYFPRGLEPTTILAQVDTALAAVESDARDGLRVIDMSEGDDAPHSAEEWRKLIGDALTNRKVRLASFPVKRLDGTLLHRECPLRLMFEESGEWQPAGRFLPVAERLKMTPQLDLTAVTLGLNELEAKPELCGLAINLSAASIQIPDFRRQLYVLLQKRSGTRRLWLEVAEAGALTHLEAFKALCNELRNVGCQMGIEHFGRRFSEIGQLHDLGLDYLKVDASFIRNLEKNPGNQAFLRGLSTIAHGIGMSVIAEGVCSEEELKSLEAVGFDGATGPAISE